MSNTLGETGRDGGDGGLSSDSGREVRLRGLNGRHASDHTVGVGHGEVGGEAIGVRDSRLDCGAAAGDIDDLGVACQ